MCNVHSVDVIAVCLGYFHRHVGRHTDELDGVHRGYGESQKTFVKIMLPVLPGGGIHGLRRKMINKLKENKREIDFGLARKEHQMFPRQMKES